MKKHIGKRIISAAISLMLLTSAMTVNVFSEEIAPMAEEEVLPYLDETLSFEERAADLVSRMTLEEKVAQLGNKASAIPRLGVSAYQYWREALHGVARQGVATSFPTSLAMSNTWNRDLIFEAADVTSTEARAKNTKLDLSYWSPTINMARDPRWGRNEETYGEDPYLTGQIGTEFVKGMQGNDEKYLKLIATVKHFIANNCEKERRSGTSVLDERTLREYYGKVFQNVVESSNPASAMSSYNATTLYRNGEMVYNYIPSAANEYTLTELLRRNWCFTGYVTGDCGAVQDVGGTEVGGKQNTYKQALFPDRDVKTVSAAESIAKSLYAGNDIDCGTAGPTTQLEAVENGWLSEDQLDVNVYRLFLQRMKTGEFDTQANVPYTNITKDVLEADAHVAVAEKAAEETWVLLKNNGILPLNKEKKNIAIVGNFADEVFLGDYSGEPTKTVTPYKGLVEQLKTTNPDAAVSYLGGVPSDVTLFNLKSLNFVLEDGTTRKIDLSKATAITGAVLSNGTLTGINRNFTATIPNVDCSKVVSVKAEMASNGTTGTLKLGYGDSTLTVASIASKDTASLDTYEACTGDYTGNTGGYNGTKSIVLTVTANSPEFSVEAYKEQLDAADVIIAYAGTNLTDSSESNDRLQSEGGINFPKSQAHVAQIAEAYPEKTVVAMQTVGQMNVEDFKDKVAAIMWTSYNGQTQGTAFAKILTGEVNPSGRLTTTWYPNADLIKMNLEDDNTVDVAGLAGSYNDYSIRPSDTKLGRTYQYYSGTPVYPFGYGLSYTDFEYSNINISKSNVDVNETITVTATVKNTGSVAGKEVVQLYVTAPGGDGKALPSKQLKNFEKIELNAGETKTVSMELNVKDVSFFNEKDQKIYVPNGEFTVMVGKNANDANALTAKFNATGTLESKIKTVAVVPTGVTLKGVYAAGDTASVTENPIKAQASVYMTDEVKYDISKADVKYTSSNERVALVDGEGTVTAGIEEGVATITVTANIDGVTKSASFPVTCEIIEKASDELKASYIAKLDTEYAQCVKAAYSDANYAKVTDIYTTAKTVITEAIDLPTVNSTYEEAIKALRAVEMDLLKNAYTLSSENPLHISDNTIEYKEGGIPMYIAGTSSVTGIINAENPYSQIQLKAAKGADTVDAAKLKWKVEKVGEYNREPAEINYDTGVLTVKENGLIKITAINTEALECGTALVLVNLQVEGEFADEANGADITDVKNGASGSQMTGNNAGSTKQYWLEFKGIRLEGLKQIILRTSYKTEGSTTLNVSLAANTYPASLIAKGTVSSTGDWSSWAEATLDVDQAVLANAVADENGLSSLYIQTNTANLDYFRLVYEEPNKYPYTVKAMESDAAGAIKVAVSHKLGTENGVLVGAVFDENGKMTKSAYTDVTNSGTYTLNGGFTGNDNISVFVWNDINEMKPISEVSSLTYKEMELVVYNFSDSAFDDFFGVKGGADSVPLPEVNGMEGYSLWVAAGGGKYNFRGTDYTFTRSLQAGSGGDKKRCVYFTPKSECKVTVLFDGNGNAGREMHIAQKGSKLATAASEQSGIVEFSVDITDTSAPVYVYGGGSNKRLFAVFVEYK